MDKSKVETKTLDIGERNENDVIADLFKTDENYRDNVDYDLCPENGENVGRHGDGHNSNSFVAGLLEAVGLDTPEIKSNTPGYDKPLPKEHFIKDPWMPSTSTNTK